MEKLLVNFSVHDVAKNRVEGAEELSFLVRCLLPDRHANTSTG
jgi:hypothetical protein